MHLVHMRTQTQNFFFERKTVKGRCAMSHGQGTVELVECETGCVGPVEEVLARFDWQTRKAQVQNMS